MLTKGEYEFFWLEIIKEKCQQLTREYGGVVFEDGVKDEIWQYFEETYNYAKNHYMVTPNVRFPKPLNRYKVAASFMIAILKARPLKKADQRYYKEYPNKWIFNEALALFVGLSVIRCYIMSDVEDNQSNLTKEQREFLRKKFEKSIPLSDENKKRWECELYFLRHEGCYNLLTLSHELEDYVTIVMAPVVLPAVLHEQTASVST